MMAFRILLSRKIESLGLSDDILISQRLKRTPSIIQKLKINKKMKLARMQDIGGLRVVVDSLENLYNLHDQIRMSESYPAFKSIFANEKDYIKDPKESGYRSLHLIYKYGKNSEESKKCRIEIQLRTKLHHAWATAVEVVGTYLNQPLKQSFGSEDLLKLFQKISKAFILLETDSRDDSLFAMIKQEVNRVKLIEKLHGFNVVTKILYENKKMVNIS